MNAFMTPELVNAIVKVVIMIVVIVIGRYLVPFIKSNVDYKQLALVQSIAIQVVESAEMIFKHGENDSKLAYATNLLSDILGKYNITLSPDEIRSSIEEAVLDLKQNK